MLELLTVMLIVSTATVAVQVYKPASEVLTGLNWILSVLAIRNGFMEILLKLVSSGVLSMTALLLHTMTGSTTSPSTTPTSHVKVREDPGDIVPIVVIITEGGGRAGAGTSTYTHRHTHTQV